MVAFKRLILMSTTKKLKVAKKEESNMIQVAVRFRPKEAYRGS